MDLQRLSLLLLSLSACATPPPGDLGTCPDDAAITWADAQPIFDQHCTSCHSADLTGDDRNGAPAVVDFDTPESARNLSHAAWAAIFSDRMPPTDDALTIDEQQILWTWWSCEGPE